MECKTILAAAAVVLLAGCGTQMGDRMATGAAIGRRRDRRRARAIIGAAVGGLTSPDDVNLGEPVWDE